MTTPVKTPAINLGQIAQQFEMVLAQEAKAYMDGSQADIDAFGESGEAWAKAILADEMYSDLPFPLKKDLPTADDLANREEICTARITVLQLCAAAERIDAARVKAMRARAKAGMVKIGMAFAAVGIGAAKGYLAPMLPPGV